MSHSSLRSDGTSDNVAVDLEPPITQDYVDCLGRVRTEEELRQRDENRKLFQVCCLILYVNIILILFVLLLLFGPTQKIPWNAGNIIIVTLLVLFLAPLAIGAILFVFMAVSGIISSLI